MNVGKVRRNLARLALFVAGAPFVTTATCDPYRGVLDFYRNDDHSRHGWFDIFLDDCFYYDCHYDDYYYDEIFIFD